MTCAVCDVTLPDDSEKYDIGPMRIPLCPTCVETWPNCVYQSKDPQVMIPQLQMAKDMMDRYVGMMLGRVAR